MTNNKYANSNYAIDHAPQCSAVFTLAQSQPHPDLQSGPMKKETLAAAGCGSPGGGGGGSEMAIMSSKIISTRTLQGQRHTLSGGAAVSSSTTGPVPGSGPRLLGLDPDSVPRLLGLDPDYWVCTGSTGSGLVLLGLDWLYWVRTGSTGSYGELRSYADLSSNDQQDRVLCLEAAMPAAGVSAGF